MDERTIQRLGAVVLGALLLGSLGVAAVGGQQPTAKETSEHDHGLVRGEVVDQSGDPKGGMEVRIVDVDSGGTVATLTTASDGSFGPLEIDPGNYTARVDAPGWRDYSTVVNVESNEAEKIEVVLERVTGQVKGSVVEQDGDAVSGEEVQIRFLHNDSTAARVTTRSDGGFGPVEVPAEANYTAVVDAPGWVTYADRVHLDPDETETVQVVLDPVTGHVKGTVTDTDGDPVAGVDVALRLRSNGSAMATPTTRSDGSFGPVEVPASAEYVVHVDERGWAEFATAIELDPDETETVPVTLRRTAANLSGTVRDDAGTGLGGVEVRLVNVSSGSTAHTLTTRPDGSWGPTAVALGTWEVAADAPGHRSASRTVQVAGGESVRLTLVRRVALSVAATTGPLEPGEEVSVEVAVDNPSTATRTVNLSLAVDGTTQVERTVAVAGGASRTVTLAATPSLEPATYQVVVRGDNRTAEAAVEVLSPTTPTATDRATATPTATGRDDGDPTPSASPTSGDGASGFTLVLALAAVAAGLLFAARRRG